MTPSPPVCVWLKRDLRVSDHAALATAVSRAQGGAVFATFLYEPEIYAQPVWSSRHTGFEHECLLAVAESLARLGIRLITRQGEAVAMLEELRREAGFRLLVAHEETGTGVSYARDLRVRKWAREAGVEFVEVPQTGVVRRLRSRNGWNRLWETRMQSPAAIVRPASGRGGLDTVRNLQSHGLLSSHDLGHATDSTERQRGGETLAADVLDDFLSRRGRSYAGGISSPLSAATSCSRLSPYLAFGAISMRTVWQASETRREEITASLATATAPAERATLRAWQRSLRGVQSRLHWHCHFMQKLEDEPEIEFHNMVRAVDGLREQAIEQDPQGVFIKRWVPELAGVPPVFIHMPWTMPAAVQQAAGCRIDREYPAPIVDHAVAIRMAKQRLAAVRADPRARAEARDVARRHGSRRDRRGAMQQDPVRRHLQREPPAAHADPQHYFSFFHDDGEPHQDPSADR